MPYNKTCEGLIRDLVKYALKDVEPAQEVLSECETELTEGIRDMIQGFIAGISETEEMTDRSK